LKALPTIFAVTLALLLTVAPLTASAAGTVTFTSPTAGAPLSGSYTITGTVSPAPTTPDNLFIQVLNPSGALVNVYDTPVTINTGAFSQAATTGSGSQWTSGTYTIKATDTYSATGSTTFTFTAVSPPPTTSAVALQVWAYASTPVQPGDTVGVSALVAWSNGTAVSSATFAGWWISPAGIATALTTSPVKPAGTTGVYWWNIPVSSTASDGLNAIVLGATAGKTTAWTQTAFTVDSSFASSSALASLSSSVSSKFAALTSMVNSSMSALAGLPSAISGISATVGATSTSVGIISTAVTNMQSAVSSISTGVTSLQSTVGSIASAVNGLTSSMTSLSSSVGQILTAANSATTAANNAAAAANSAKTAINNTSTYVLAVVVIVAITLVLELAILVRKLS